MRRKNGNASSVVYAKELASLRGDFVAGKMDEMEYGRHLYSLGFRGNAIKEIIHAAKATKK